IRNQFTLLSGITLPDALCWHDYKHSRIAFAIARGNSSYPDCIWFYDTRLRSWTKQTGFYVTSALVDSDGSIYTGDQNGNIYRHADTLHSYNGSAIVATIQTPYLDFFEPRFYKRITQANITLRGNGSYSLGIGC